LTYSAADLQKYVDSLGELSLMVEEAGGGRLYRQQGKGFLKGQILEQLRKAAAA
jgi:hypothetical protein